MAIGPAHTYIQEGLDNGVSLDNLKGIQKASLALKSKNFTYIHSLGHLAHCSRVNFHYLRNVVKRRGLPYEIFSVPKRSGGHRYLASPEKPLKQVQQWINKYILSSNIPHWRCFSYKSGVSIIDAAKEHCSSKWLIKIDIENFFDSVNEVSVYKLFRGMGYCSLVSFELARLCTFVPAHVSKNHFKRSLLYNTSSDDLPYPKKGIKFLGRLPQGAPSSPSISNLVFEPIDIVLQNYAEHNDLVYSRYADDICFSSDSKNFSREKAMEIINFCSKEIRRHGYATKKMKTKIIPPGVPKVVLGLNVNHSNPKLTKAFKKRLEGHIRGIEHFGAVEHANHKKFISVFGMLDHVLGLINHAKLVEGSYAEQIHEKFKSIIKSQRLS